VAEIAVHPPVEGALTRVVEIARELAGYRGAPCLDVWVRRVDDGRRKELVDVGCRVRRTLGVLRCPLGDGSTPTGPDGLKIRPATPADDGTIVEVLEAAHHGTDDGGWTVQRFAARAAAAWFRYEDVRLAEADGVTVGLVWLKRRDDGVGEIHNLAVRPEAHGRGIGRMLLVAGEDHLRDTGLEEVVLWVDRDNEPAVRLYEQAGYVTAWDDVLVTTCEVD
ncbi:MAG: GNAT family N-acetyltransferase, partial [Nitriliruptoraceae bacterium]